MPVAERGPAVAVISHGAQVDIAKHLARGNVTIVDFYADWCGPCRQVSPNLEQMANTDPEIALRKIDIVNWNTAVARQYNVHSIPQVSVYNRDGRLVGTVNGVRVEEIRRLVAESKNRRLMFSPGVCGKRLETRRVIDREVFYESTVAIN